MGAEQNSNENHITNGNGAVFANGKEDNAPLVLGLQPSALVDYVAKVDWSLLDQIPGERGGSIPVILA